MWRLSVHAEDQICQNINRKHYYIDGQLPWVEATARSTSNWEPQDEHSCLSPHMAFCLPCWFCSLVVTGTVHTISFYVPMYSCSPIRWTTLTSLPSFQDSLVCWAGHITSCCPAGLPIRGKALWQILTINWKHSSKVLPSCHNYTCIMQREMISTF